MVQELLLETPAFLGRILSDIQSVTKYMNAGIVIALVYVVVYYLMILLFRLLKIKYNHKRSHVLSVFLLLVYTTAIFYIVFMSREVGEYSGANLRLFSSWGKTNTTHAYFVENIIMFVPMGILLPCSYGRFRKVYKCVLTCLLISLVIEIIQYIFGIGIAEIDDVLNNTIGGFIGWCIWRVCAVCYKNLTQK